MRLMNELENEIKKFELLSRRIKLEKSIKGDMMMADEPEVNYGKKQSVINKKIFKRKKAA